jgi:hypothetical protein
MSTPPGHGHGGGERPADEHGPGGDPGSTPPPPPPPPPPDAWGLPGDAQDRGQSQPPQPWGQPQPWQEPGRPQQAPVWSQPQQWGPGPGGYPTPPQTNGLAVGALVASILGFFCGIGFIIGLVLGYSARGQIRASAGREGGEGAATAAIVIGWIGVGLMILAILAFVAFVGLATPRAFF